MQAAAEEKFRGLEASYLQSTQYEAELESRVQALQADIGEQQDELLELQVGNSWAHRS